jgi:hypothetical protein
MMNFANVHVGQLFDFPTGFDECEKTGPRTYLYHSHGERWKATVGTVQAEVLNIRDKTPHHWINQLPIAG